MIFWLQIICVFLCNSITTSNNFNIGPGVGAWLYEMGGFMLPFLIVGAISIILSLTLIVTIPNLGPPEEEEEPLIQDPTDVQLRYLNLGSMRKLRT